jgi:hypothetical protein
VRQREEVARVLNLFPEVAWDRFIVNGDDLTVYGWVARLDGRADFLILDAVLDDDGLRVGYTTSSAEMSAEFGRRLHGEGQPHYECQRVEAELGDLVPGCVRL